MGSRVTLTSRSRAAWLGLLPVLATCARPPDRAQPTPAGPDRIALRLDVAEAEAVLALIGDGAASDDEAWRRLFDSEGYRRLKARETAMQHPFSDGEFRGFVRSPALAARAAALRATLARWKTADLHAAAARAMVYLPAEARIAATVFPVLKPKENSFVYFADGIEPSIFLFIDPAMTEAQFENTVAHELHHIGFASLPEEKCGAAPAVCTARKWIGAFGEGFAMLAAAGGPDVHPHRDSKPADRARWDRDAARFDADLAEVQEFLRAVLAGELDEAAAQRRAMEFFGIQGPWYTVGWSMAVAVERCLGRAELIRAMRRPWTVLARFNQAAQRCPVRPARATWDRDLVAQIGD